MYINFWYPVALGKDVTNEKPVEAEIMGLNFVAFRDSDGAAHVMSNTCVHRGGALARGKIKGDRVECPYHGWQFSGDGKCQFIPTNPLESKPPARAKVDAYPTEERYGIVFAFLGDLPAEERPPIYDIPEYGQDSWRANDIVVFEINGYYQRSVENGMDGAHNEFVHPLQGAPSIIENLREHDIEVEDESEWGCGFMFAASGSASPDTKMLGAGEGRTIAGSSHHGPNTLITRINFTEERGFAQYFFEAPVSDGKTRIFFVNMRSWMLEEEMDKRIIDINMQIAHEDIDIIEGLEPVRTPKSTAKEVLTKADAPIYRYRDFLKMWDDRGWRLDWKELQRLRGDVAFAIPCPARRTEKNWVLDAVPLVEAKNAKPELKGIA